MSNFWVCVFCKKTGNTSWNSEEWQHLQSHTEEKPIWCNICGGEFTGNSILQRHKQIHEFNREKTHHCIFCEKSYFDIGNLHIHLLTHTQEKPYSCTFNLCEKSFVSSSRLKRHYAAVHSQVKEHHCNECGRSFAYRESLSRHLMIHRNEKPYSCAKCGMAFRDPNVIKKHQLLQINPREFKCSECCMSFDLHRTLKFHVHCAHFVNDDGINKSGNKSANDENMRFSQSLVTDSDLASTWSGTVLPIENVNVKTENGSDDGSGNLNGAWGYNRKLYQCDLCKMLFIQLDELEYHVLHAHNDRRILNGILYK